MTKSLSPVNVGIDVGKAQLDVYLLERDRSLTVPNDEPAIAALVKRLKRYRLERIVIEATGRLEQPFLRAALTQGLPVIVVSPLKVRRFAATIGQLAKTDQIDARLIARFGATVKPPAYPVADPKAQFIKDLAVRRRQLIQLRTMERNRRQVMPDNLTDSIDRLIRAINEELLHLEQLIDQAIHAHTAWRHKRDLLVSMPASATPSPPHSSATCPSSAPCRAAKSPHSPASHPSTTTAASSEANDVSAAAGLIHAPHSS